ncbi:hypothetical protein LCGC14_1824160, partial [marine sediment metagenome]
VYGQIFNGNNTKIGNEFRINTYTLNSQAAPSVTSLNDGNFIVIWQSYGQDGDGYGIYGQIFNADGTKSGSEFPVNTYTTNYQQLPSVASLSNGAFVVTWQSLYQDGDGDGVYGQIFNADGTKSGSEFQINTYTTTYQMRSSVTSLNNGKFVVAWQSDGDGWGVYGQLFNADGTKNGSEFPVNTYTTGAQVIPSVSSLSNGQFVVTWQSRDQDGDDYGVYGQIFNADGTKSGSEFQVNTYTTNYQEAPSIASLNNDKFVVTWTSGVFSGLGQDGDGMGVYGQIFNADGTKSGSEFQVNTYTTSHQSNPSVASLRNGQFVVTWDSNDQDGNGGGVYGQIFEAIIPTTSSTSSTTSSSTSSTTTSSSSTESSSSSSSTFNTASTTNSQSLLSTSSSINGLAITSVPLSSSSSTPQTEPPSLTTKTFRTVPDSENLYSTSLNNYKLITWLGIGAIGCIGSICLSGFIYARFRKSKKNKDISLERIKVDGANFELNPTMKIQHLNIGDEYLWFDKIDKSMAADIYKNTGYLFTFPERKDVIKSTVGEGCFGKIKIAKRESDNEYVASKRIRKENIEASKEEAEMQKKALGPNILRIYNTVTFENTMYHFLPLAGLGSGLNIQKQLSSIKDPNLASEVLKFVAKDVLTGLQTIHEKDLCHLDMKASNIVFKDDGTAYITDFGCAKDGKILLKTHGDKDYFSPGRLAASSAGDLFDGQKADMWATGIMLLGMYKNKSPSDLFGPRSDWSEDILDEFFQEKLDQFEELQSPNEGTIWWVIKHLLDTSEETRFTANQALDAACFKGLLKSIQSTLFQNMRSNNLIGTAHIDREIDISDYGFASALQALREEERTLEIQELILNYDFQPEVTPENIRSGENTDYKFS